MIHQFHPIKGISLALGLAIGSSAILTALEPLQANPTLGATETIEIAQAGRKIRIAILDFDFSSVSNPQLLSVFPGIARGTSDIAVNEFVKEGTYSVVERSQIESILAEQDFGASGRVDTATAAEIGRILGVDAVLVGSVTQFDVQQQRRSGSFVVVRKRRVRTTANVGLSARLISTNTAEILAVAEGIGAETQEDRSEQIFGIGNVNETDNQQQLLAAATREAVASIVIDIAQAAPKLGGSPATARAAEIATIADVTDGVVVLNRGTNSGFQNGAIVAVERVTREVTDPQTGKVLRKISSEVSRLELYDVDTGSSLGRVISGTAPEVGDVVKPVSP